MAFSLPEERAGDGGGMFTARRGRSQEDEEEGVCFLLHRACRAPVFTNAKLLHMRRETQSRASMGAAGSTIWILSAWPRQFLQKLLPGDGWSCQAKNILCKALSIFLFAFLVDTPRTWR